MEPICFITMLKRYFYYRSINMKYSRASNYGTSRSAAFCPVIRVSPVIRVFPFWAQNEDKILPFFKALVVPQISGTRSTCVPFQIIGNAFLLRSFFKVGTRVPFCVPFAFLFGISNATKYHILNGFCHYLSII